MLIALVLLLTWAQRPLLRIPAGIGPPGPWSPAILLGGLAATMFGLARLAIGGLAPGGSLAVLPLAAFAAGLLGAFCTGRPSGTGHPASTSDATQPASSPAKPVVPRG